MTKPELNWGKLQNQRPNNKLVLALYHFVICNFVRCLLPLYLSLPLSLALSLSLLETVLSPIYALGIVRRDGVINFCRDKFNKL